MALINRPTASMVFVLLDETGNYGRLRLSVPYATLASVAILGADVLAPFIRALTGCTVVSYGIGYSKFDNQPPAPDAGSRVERKGVFVFNTAAGKKVKYEVPGVTPGIITPTGRIDEDLPQVVAFTGAMVAVDAVWSDSNGVDLISLSAAYERSRRTTRPQLPTPRTPDLGVVPELD